MWNKIQEMQKELDGFVMKTQGIKKQPINELIIATLVEFAEAINDSRSFKYWVQDPSPKSGMLEEFADFMHFMASLANKLEIKLPENVHFKADNLKKVNKYVLDIFQNLSTLNLDKLEYSKIVLWNFEVAWCKFLAITEFYGFDENELLAAYETKNLLNYKRQREGY